MKAEIRDAWADALESGEYEQGIGSLTSVVNGKEQHCCLGVLCQLAVKAGVIPEPEGSPTGARLLYGKEGENSFLPLEVQEWAGAEERTWFNYNDELRGADWLNDIAELRFPEIAALVRTQL